MSTVSRQQRASLPRLAQKNAWVRDRSDGHVEMADAQVEKRISQALRQSGHRQLRGIEVAAHDGGHVCLHGRVSSYYLKQKAQALAQGAGGVATVENQLVVE